MSDRQPFPKPRPDPPWADGKVDDLVEADELEEDELDEWEVEVDLNELDDDELESVLLGDVFVQRYQALLRDAHDLGDGLDPLPAERAVAGLLAIMESFADSDSPFTQQEALADLFSDKYPSGLVIACLLAELAEDAELRATVAARVHAHAAAGAVLPRWAPLAGKVTLGRCTIVPEQYGNAALVIVEFIREGSLPHAITAMLDFLSPRPLVRQLHLETQVDELCESISATRDPLLGEPLDGDPRFWLEVIAGALNPTPPQLRTLHRMAEIRTGSEDALAAAIIVRARARQILGEVPEPFEVSLVPPADEITGWIAQFMRSAPVAELADIDPRSLVGWMSRIYRWLAEHSDANPNRTAPIKTVAMVGDFRLEIGDDPTERELMGRIVRAWVLWRAEENGIDQAPLGMLLGRLDEALAPDPEPVRAAPPASGGDPNGSEAPNPATVRRRFAFPTWSGASTEGGARADSPTGPDDPVTRMQLILTDHKGLAGQLREVGVDRQQISRQLAKLDTVQQQIWLNSPQTCWDAAQRMLATGMTRAAVLDQLAAGLGMNKRLRKRIRDYEQIAAEAGEPDVGPGQLR